ncbi:thiolase family protein [Streptomyces sp. NRRL S-1813]|uniref:thiolase family protein n=1 Tax=Streptomyces sp. NRRL S-1813 TaxID=1463888 RepID=UPI0004C80D01|nr:thiolase family protein [Streptomyces sp. NRRL S-1813]
MLIDRPRDVYVVDAFRTPIGTYGGMLSAVRPDDLAAHVVKAVVDRAPGPDPARIDDVYLGNANGAGEENRDVARMAVLLAGLPVTVPGVTVNRLCGSGMEAVIQAARAVALGEGAELIADRYGITREQQDTYAPAGHEKAARAWKDGAFDAEVVPYGDDAEGTAAVRDEGIREDTSLQALGKLRPAFRETGDARCGTPGPKAGGGTVTAGNSSPLNDGAAALLLMDEQELRASGGEPLARIRSSAVTGITPQHFGLGPVEAAGRALKKAGRGFEALHTVELNEAFAAQALGCLAGWPDLDPALVNPHGGAIALGHPLGASGARITGAAAHRLAAAGSGTGLATLCIGVGQGLAVVLER